MIYGKAIIQLTATALLFALTIPAQAQQAKKVPRIGYLRFIEFPLYDAAFRQGLSELGYTEQENIQVEYRSPR